MPKQKMQYLVKHILKKLSKKGQKELVSFLEVYKYRYLDNNRSECLFLFSNGYTKLVSQKIIIEKFGILETCWNNFIADCNKKDDFKRYIAQIAYKNEDECLKLIVKKFKKFDELYKCLYVNNPFIIKEYIELLIGKKEYSTYYINPKLKDCIWHIKRKIYKNKREKKRHLRLKHPPTFDNNFWDEMERMFPGSTLFTHK